MRRSIPLNLGTRESKSRYWELWSFTEGLRWRIAWAVAVGLAAAVLGIARLALLGWLLAMVFNGAGVSELALPMVVVAIIMVARGALEYWRNMVAHRTAALVQMRLRQRLQEQVMALGPAYFGLERTGEVLLSMVEGVERLEIYFGQYIPQCLVAALTPVMVFAFTAYLDLPVALTLLGFALFTLIAPAAFHRWDAASSLARRDAYASFASEFLDSIQGLATLKAFGQSQARARRLAEEAYALFRSTMWVLATNSLSRGIVDTGLAVGAAAALGLGAYRVAGGDMSLEALLIILMMGIEVFRPQRDLRTLLHDGMVGRSAAEGILDLLAARPLVVAPDHPQNFPEPFVPSVEFEGVSFSYPGARRVAHRKLSFRIEPGERVGFVGPSGAGKTSIVRLVLRLYDPQGGAVRMGGVDLRSLDPEHIYAHVAVVNQDTYLFHATVAENLRFGKSDATQDELEAAAKAANAHEFISALPQGYATVVGERGIRLSGGQRQRIAIARALLRDAPILVLDEALSAVDAENEATIQQALDRLMVGRTTLIFAHRLSSVIGAHRLLVLNEGALVEEGTHAELMAKGGIYSQLMAAQVDESRGEAEVGGELATSLPGSRIHPPSKVAQTPAPAPAKPAPDGIVTGRELGWLGALKALFGHVRPWKTRLLLTFVFGVARVVALIGVGVVSALVVAAVRNQAPFDHWLWLLAILAPTAGILHWCESWVAHDMAFRMLAEMRIALFEKLERLAPAYLLRRRSGDLVSMATHDVELVEYFFAHTVAPAFVAVLVPLVVMLVLGWAAWPLALALAPFLLLVALTPFLRRKRVDELASRAREALGDLNAHVVDTIQGLAEVIAFGQGQGRREALEGRAQAHVRMRAPFFADLSLETSLLEVATGLGGLAVVVTGAGLVVEGSLPATWLPLLVLLGMAAFLPVSEIAQVSRQLADTLGATRRLHAVDQEKPAVADGAGSPNAVSAGMGLELENVVFSYPEQRKPALDGVSFVAPAGSTVALVGPSGAGKTTVAYLLMRFFDPAQGRVAMNGIDLRDYALDDLRQRIALVSQDTYLFNESLRDNIMLAKPEATPRELDLAMERAALADFVAALPKGLDTQVGERGVRLSGGQRQRVAIARAFLKDAPVLILDEATSHLDAVNEATVREALEGLMVNRTTVIIAHRLSTVRAADQIVVLSDGQVVERGSHEVLLNQGGIYQQLVGRQLAGAAPKMATV